MRKQCIIILLTAIMAIQLASASMVITTWGHGKPPADQHLIGDNWILGGGILPCTSSWNCSSFTACSLYNRKQCLAVTDLAGCAASNFTGSLTDYDANCSWCGENPTLEVCQETDNMYILIIIPLVFGLFAIIGSATLGEDHKVLKIALFLMSLVSVTASLYIGGVALGEDYPNLTIALGQTTYWIGWTFAVIIMYFLLYAIYKITRGMAKQKEEELEY